ncbi:hypothetical protein R83H12_00539 [Fibrobacteria bacterium R8-3-H12]
MTEIDTKEYRRFFIEQNKEIHKKAYEIANDNRKFEIENYWKRANYYWLFQASVYAGYFYSVTAKDNEYLCQNPEIIVGLTCLGFLTALAWYLSNKGSKKWQENWENHVAELEDGITGPLYKTVSKESTWSVSKINKLVSGFSVAAWVLLGLNAMCNFFCYPLAFLVYLLVLALISVVFAFWGKGKGLESSKKWFRLGGEDE